MNLLSTNPRIQNDVSTIKRKVRVLEDGKHVWKVREIPCPLHVKDYNAKMVCDIQITLCFFC